jgi:DNA mismatch repair protein MutS
VEMQEVASLLAHATRRSLLVLDEVGRGTSTYDGVSIAWAVVDYLMKKAPRTLFATHYFELTQLADKIPGVANAHATAKEWTTAEGKKQVIFLYQILPGPADRSYGIHVAEMAGVPRECISRARDILRTLESGTHAAGRLEGPTPSQQLDLFSDHPAVQRLRACDLNNMTPLQALHELGDLRAMVVES